jgi:hypothetical protein
MVLIGIAIAIIWNDIERNSVDADTVSSSTGRSDDYGHGERIWTM